VQINDSRGRARIGVIVPFTNTNLEPDLMMMRPSAYAGQNLGNYSQGEMTPDQVVELGIRADSPQAEAIVLSCTDMRAVEATENWSPSSANPSLAATRH
jgi:maleate cis-trans isomerase